ncbi:MAG: 2-amino-4-hydroxy-6-hydroxymethyldihydropteridine diphosphokinase [Deltaproteobacteria bacterium]
MAVEVALLLGSNRGRRVRHLRGGVDRLCREVSIDRLSRIHAGEPSGRSHQPWFLNLAAVGTTSLSPEELLRFCKEVERAEGRGGGPRWGPRELDVDILLMGEIAMRKPELSIPHPMMAERRFVLMPLAEIAPELRVPPGGETVRELLNRCRDRSEVIPL